MKRKNNHRSALRKQSGTATCCERLNEARMCASVKRKVLRLSNAAEFHKPRIGIDVFFSHTTNAKLLHIHAAPKLCKPFAGKQSFLRKKFCFVELGNERTHGEFVVRWIHAARVEEI